MEKAVAGSRRLKLRSLVDVIRAETHREDFGVRVIITLKIVKGAALILAGIAALSLLGEDLAALVRGAAEALHVDPDGAYAEWLISKVSGVTPRTLALIGAGSFFYSVVMFVEAYGLHYRLTWAAVLTIAASSLGIPVEIYELIKHASLGKVLALVINSVVVFYLYRHRSLFHPTKLGKKLSEKLRRRVDEIRTRRAEKRASQGRPGSPV
jgi:uncharacterized membrane protein (DUF2068 family)